MINREVFLNLVEKYCTSVETHGDEIKINSIFTEDTGHHLWCNPVKNAFHCWKSEKSGNLFELVSLLCKCGYQEAVSLLADDNILRSLEDKVNKLFSEKKEKIVLELKLPPATFAIDSLKGFWRKKSENYIIGRNLNIEGLMFCIAGRYYNRIVIPYYGPDGKLIYWNARDIGGSRVRYMGPDSKHGLKSDVIYMKHWPKAKSKIYLTEGEFDALSLVKCGLNGAAAGGKVLSDKQVDLLRPYDVCICFDADKSGSEALNKMGDKLINNGIQKVSYVRPPVNTKDWNKMLIDFGESVVNSYIQTQEKPFTAWTSIALRLNSR